MRPHNLKGGNEGRKGAHRSKEAAQIGRTTANGPSKRDPPLGLGLRAGPFRQGGSAQEEVRLALYASTATVTTYLGLCR